MNSQVVEAENTCRLFVAINMPDGNWAAVQRAQDCLRDTNADVRWVAEKNLHLTLIFIGNVSARDVDDIQDRLLEAGHGHAPFSLSLRGVGAFPNIRRPKTIWAACEGNLSPLYALAKSVESALGVIGFQSDQSFKPHLTLGRVRSGYRGQELTTELHRLRDEPITIFQVESFALIKSDLQPQGPVYTALARYALSQSGK